MGNSQTLMGAAAAATTTQRHPHHRPLRSISDGMEVRSVGNSQTLKETALIEAFNLKAAIEFTMKNMEAAKVGGRQGR